MAVPPEIKRIIKEDFPKDQQELIDKLAFSLNPFFEQVVNALTKQIDMSNLAQEIKEINATISLPSNLPKQTIQFNTILNTKVRGIVCIRAQNLTNPNVPVTTAPFVQFTPQGQLITINSVTGLPALSGDPTTSQTFKLTLLLIT